MFFKACGGQRASGRTASARSNGKSAATSGTNLSLNVCQTILPKPQRRHRSGFSGRETESRMSRQSLEVEYVVNAVCLAGLLRSADVFGDVLRLSLELSVPEPNLRKHLLGLLKIKRQHASSTTLRRHKLTLHMSWCRFQQEEIKSFLVNDEFVCWATFDLSPAAGYEWLLSGFSIVKVGDLIAAFDLSARLFDTDLPAEDARETLQELS